LGQEQAQLVVALARSIDFGEGGTGRARIAPLKRRHAPIGECVQVDGQVDFTPGIVAICREWARLSSHVARGAATRQLSLRGE
jgi:hypothetical protein